MNELRKSIAYAYPTSKDAEHFGMSETGCFYIEQQIINIEGSGQVGTGIHPQGDSEGFLTHDDPALRELFAQVDGETCPFSKKYHPEYYADQVTP